MEKIGFPSETLPRMDQTDEDETLFESIKATPIATVITNPRLADNPIVALNRAFEELTGYSSREALGRNCRFLAGPETEPWSSAVLRNAVAAGQPALTEMLNYKRDGTPFRNAVMIAPVFDDSGTLAFFIGSQMDLTEGDNLPSITRRRRAGEQVSRLTPRQRQVLREMTMGLRNKQIAAKLGLNEKTVKMHRAALLTKLEVASSADAVRIAVEANL